MNVYKVEGKVLYEQKCDCSYCMGHDEEGVFSVEVEAKTLDLASKIGLKAIENNELGWGAKGAGWAESDTWGKSNPVIEFVRELSEETLMLRAGNKPLWSLLQTA